MIQKNHKKNPEKKTKKQKLILILYGVLEIAHTHMHTHIHTHTHQCEEQLQDADTLLKVRCGLLCQGCTLGDKNHDLEGLVKKCGLQNELT